MKNIFNNLSNIISNTLFPIKCILCNQDKTYLCVNCENKLPILSHEKKLSDWIFCKYKYQDYNIKKIEHAIKYKHHPKLGEAMGEYSYEFILKNIINKIENQEDLDTNKNIYLIPIPISKERLRQRGYNQTEYVVKGINKMNPNLKILNMLSREKTKKLKDVYGVDNRAEEIRYSMSMSINLDILGGGYAAAPEKKTEKDIYKNLKDKNNIFILIDDISTTGATFYEARRALTSYGIISKNIYAFALAH